MSKKSKGWFWKSKEPVESPYTKMYDEDGVEISTRHFRDFEDDVWTRKPQDKKVSMWGDYEKTGEWRGYDYYKPAKLSYSYVQQMANMIASSHNVKVQVGNEWGVDIKGKTLTYNPVSLMYMSKGEVLATLLHEVGKISMCLHKEAIKNHFLTKYDKPAYDTISTFDDFRVDETMIKAYPAAEEVYESQDEILKKVVKVFTEKDKHIGVMIKEGIKRRIKQIKEHIRNGNGYNESYQAIFRQQPPTKVSTLKDLEAWGARFDSEPYPTIYGYTGIVVDKGYGINSGTHPKYIEDLFALTSGAVEKSVKAQSTQEVSDIMTSDVFPHIEELLISFNDGSKTLQEGAGKQTAKSIAEEAEIYASNGGNVGDGKQTNISRGQMAGKFSLPKEWADGDYNALKESVSYEIKSLYQKMLNLRRSEAVVKWEDHQRRGKLNQKTLYKHRQGITRLFRKKLETTDTIRSFTFSIMVDVSGSMAGSKIIHTTRALILLSEVFTKLGMDFEILHFDNNVKATKKFEDTYDKKAQNRVAGFVTNADGGTELGAALKASGIQKRPEVNRVAIVLTDGDTESHQELNSKYFTPWRAKGIQSIVIGLETPLSSIRGLAGGTGVAIKNAAEMPQVFYEILKKLIFKR